MLVLAYIDPGTTGLIAQFAALGFTGVVVYFKSRFRKTKPDVETESESEQVDESA